MIKAIKPRKVEGESRRFKGKSIPLYSGCYVGMALDEKGWKQLVEHIDSPGAAYPGNFGSTTTFTDHKTGVSSTWVVALDVAAHLASREPLLCLSKTLAHEASHVTDFVIDHAAQGDPLSFGTEARAYLHEWLFGLLWTFYTDRIDFPRGSKEGVSDK